MEVLNNKGSLHDWNDMIVTLIPKIKDPKTIQEFRPIRLCSVSYKIIAKVITNRFKSILRLVVDPFQSVFIPGRSITDNIIIGYECMHWLRNSKSKQGFATLKLDMSKAYDRLECPFLKATLLALRFSDNLDTSDYELCHLILLFFQD